MTTPARQRRPSHRRRRRPQQPTPRRRQRSPDRFPEPAAPRSVLDLWSWATTPRVLSWRSSCAPRREAAVARAGLAAARPQPADTGSASRRGRPPRRSVRHLVHVAGAGPAHQRLRRRAAGDRAGVAPRCRRPGPPRVARPPGVTEWRRAVPPGRRSDRAAPVDRRLRAGACLRPRAALGVRRVERRRGEAVPAARSARGARAQPDVGALHRCGRAPS